MSESAMESTTSKANGIAPPVSGQKRQFTDEFKNGLVARVKKGEVAGAVAAEYKLSGSVLRRWVAAAKGVNKGKPIRRKVVPGIRGVTVGPDGRKGYSDEFKVRAVRRLEKGEPATQLAKALGINDSMLYNWSKKFGAAKGKVPRKGTDPRFTDAFKRNIVQRYRNGEKPEDIAKEQRVDKSTIYYWASAEKKAAERAPATASASPAHPQKAAVSYLNHALSAKSEQVRVALITLALASLKGEM